MGLEFIFIWEKKEHEPPHIHAKYGEYKASFDIKKRNLLEGEFPPRAARLVSEFIEQYELELLKMWETQEFKKLKGLD